MLTNPKTGPCQFASNAVTFVGRRGISDFFAHPKETADGDLEDCAGAGPEHESLELRLPSSQLFFGKNSQKNSLVRGGQSCRPSVGEDRTVSWSPGTHRVRASQYWPPEKRILSEMLFGIIDAVPLKAHSPGMLLESCTGGLLLEMCTGRRLLGICTGTKHIFSDYSRKYRFGNAKQRDW